MNRIIPTVFALNKKAFNHRFDNVVKISDEIQIDFMDGKFVPSKSIKISDVPELKKYDCKFEAHLMVKNPEEWLPDLKNKGFKKVIFHVESNPRHIRTIIDKANQLKLEVWLALNPETDLSAVIPHIHSVSGILFMGVHPGKEHQDFIHEVYKKIAELKRFSKSSEVQVDGGINLDIARRLKILEVDIINTGSFVSDSDNPKKALEKLKKAFS